MENLYFYPPLKGCLEEESRNLKIMSKLDELVHVQQIKFSQ